jgi:hypothetical protein
MKPAKPTRSQKQGSQVQLARLRLARAESSLESAREQARLAKRRRKEAKQSARRAKKLLRQAKDELAEAKQALTDAEKDFAQTRMHPARTGPRAKARRTARAPLARRKKQQAVPVRTIRKVRVAAAGAGAKVNRPDSSKAKSGPARPRPGRTAKPITVPGDWEQSTPTTASPTGRAAVVPTPPPAAEGSASAGS